MSKEVQIELARKIQEHYSCRVIMDEEKEPYCLICAADIGKVLGIKNINANLISICNRILVKCETNGGEQNISFLTYSSLYKILAKSRKPSVIEFCHTLQIDISSKIYTCIMESFSHEKMIQQYRIQSYMVDLYFPKYKLIIECDETFHRTQKNQENDKKREDAIKSEDAYTFIRYDPYVKEFNIFHVIQRIVMKICGGA
jgi:very-short-patch-repair endonuclease